MPTLLERHKRELTDAQLDHFIAWCLRVLDKHNRIFEELAGERERRGIPPANLFETQKRPALEAQG